MKPIQAPSAQETIAGLVERVTFHNVENGFCVLRVKARGHRETATVIGHATTSNIHMSEKPRPVLQHFFRLFVDENTRFLDPTCGSGNAVRAADDMGAKSVQGLEINPEFCEGAQKAYVRGKGSTISALLDGDGTPGQSAGL